MNFISRFRGSTAARPVLRSATLPIAFAVLLLLSMLGLDVQPTSGHAPYLADIYHQIDGSAYEQSNCVLASSTMLMDRASVGYWRVPAWRLRQLSNDTSGGVTYELAASTTKSATKGWVVLTPSYGHSRAEMKTIIAGGHAAGVSIDCSVTINTPYHTGNYAGGHTLVAAQWRYNPTYSRDEYLIGDVGRGTQSNDTGYVWWPAWLVYKAAEARGGGEINLLVARDTEGVTRTATAAAPVWSAASSTSTRKGTLVLNQGYSVVSTQNGGSWTVNAHPGNGWHKIKWGTGTAFVAGPRLK